MTVYILAQLNITDRTKYDRYQARFMEVFKPFGGTVLSVDDSVHVIEGEWPHSRLVLASFPDEPSFRAWWDSPGYRQIVEDRWDGSTAIIVLAKGLPASA